MKLFNQGEDEKEVSGGAMFGYALIGFVVVVIIVFIIFAASKLIGGNKDSDTANQPQQAVEQTVDTTENNESAVDEE